MSECQAKGATTSLAVTPPAAPPLAAPAPAAPAAEPADGLPPQERILACATTSRSLSGEARAAYLKHCLAAHSDDAALDAERARHRAACAAQAATQPEAERQAFIASCASGAIAVAPAAINQQLAPGLREDSEPRRRAACNVRAQDRQGAARAAFIEQCTAARPAAAAPSVANTTTQLSAKERLVRSQHCAEAARAKHTESGQVMAYMNACMAGREPPDTP
jgi:hypothetical protein